MNMWKKFFTKSMPKILAMCSLFLICDYADAARTAVRATPASRKSVAVVQQQTQQQNSENVVAETKSEPVIEQTDAVVIDEPIIINKSSQFDDAISAIMESATSDNTFAEQIRQQRAALAASEASTTLKSSQQSALKSGHNACDAGLRECMMKTCGNDFTKCATDGDTIFGDKLNKCRRDIDCTGEEFKLFTSEIKSDRDMNIKLSSYNDVIICGNAYDACIQNECGTTFDNCLGKAKADAAIQKCETIAKNCKESDSGLASRFSTVIGKLRENAEKEIKADEKRLYELRDLMKNQCTALGATFDERSFDCVYTVKFFAGADKTTPTASRKRYAGKTFVCMQEWFGINATTFKENALRETRAQEAASGAMLGAGVGTAAGLWSSGAVTRAIQTQNAAKELKEAKKGQAMASDNTTTEDITTGQDGQKPDETAQPGKNGQKPDETAQPGKNADGTNYASNDLDAAINSAGTKEKLSNDVPEKIEVAPGMGRDAAASDLKATIKSAAKKERRNKSDKQIAPQSNTLVAQENYSATNTPQPSVPQTSTKESADLADVGLPHNRGDFL